MSKIERVQYKLMLPAQLKSALEEAAHDNRRSLSAELIARLYASFEADEKQGFAPSDSEVVTLSHERLREIVFDAVKAAVEMAEGGGLATSPEMRRKPTT